MRTSAQESKGVSVLFLVLVWGLTPLLAVGQVQTAVEALGTGPDTPGALERNATAVISELNSAAREQRRPTLSDLIATEQGRQDILRQWEESPFRCAEPKLERRLIRRKAGTFEIRSIPLILENGERREAILTFGSEGKVRGFTFAGTVVVHTKPSGATVRNVTRDTSLSAPARFEGLAVGTHRFVVQEEGYRSADTSLAVSAAELRRDTVRLDPGYGHVRLQGIPDQTTVQMDGTKKSIGEADRLRLRAGQPHTLTLSKQYYQTQDTVLSVETGETKDVSVRLQRKRIPLRIDSDPSGASLALTGTAVEGARTGTTPFEERVEMGRTYTVRVEKDGFIPARKRISTASDSAVDRTVVLSPLRARIQDEDVQIQNLSATRSGENVAITYNLNRTYNPQGSPEDTYNVKVSVVDSTGNVVGMASEDIQGAVGKNVTPGLNKKIEIRSPLPSGAAVQLTVGTPSQPISGTVGRQSVATGSDDDLLRFGRASPLLGVKISGENFLIAVTGIKDSDFSINGALGGNVYITRFLGQFPLATFIPIKLGGGYQRRGEFVSSAPNTEFRVFESFRLGLNLGVGGRLRLGDLPGAGSTPVLRNLIIEGSWTWGRGYNWDNQRDKTLGGTRKFDVEVKLVDLIGAGGGTRLGITLGFSRRTLQRRSAGGIGDHVVKALTGDFEKVLSERLLHFGINWN